jgi:hypothetical protein
MLVASGSSRAFRLLHLGEHLPSATFSAKPDLASPSLGIDVFRLSRVRFYSQSFVPDVLNLINGVACNDRLTHGVVTHKGDSPIVYLSVLVSGAISPEDA